MSWNNVLDPASTSKRLALNCLFIVHTGQLVKLPAEAIRAPSAKYKAVADQLSETNRQLREAEAAVRRSERLAALGQLSAGLAHELRNPLGTIKASSEMLARNVASENELAREVAGYISTEVDRCNSLVSRFLDFARPLEARLATADLTQVLDRAIQMASARGTLKAREINIYRNYAPDIPSVPLDAELMERVFFNVIQNAIQASAPGSSVTVKTRGDGDLAETCIIDRGSGIDPKLIETIFNPFVTTKPHGVGLGLAIVSRIVDRHGGKMTVESQPGEGSVFRVRLPLHARSRQILMTKLKMMKRRILVVEDEDKLRRVVELQLMSAGFDVDQAGTAEAALPRIDRADLILTDLRLPGMSGLEMLSLVQRQNTHAPVIVMTAFSSIETAVEAMKAGAIDFLPKPFSLDHLMTVVNKALEMRNLRDENRQLKEQLGRRYEFDNIIGRSPQMQDIFATILRVAPSRATVLLAGESGVGKDLIARAIHFHSPRADKQMVKINCTSIPENLMESELFSHAATRRARFTGAQVRPSPGQV